MAVPFEQFAQQLTASGLWDEARLAALLEEIPPERKTDGEVLARELVKRKHLTAFQAQQIYGGKGKGLVLGNYVILDKLGQGGMGMVLKAEHRRLKRLVALKVLSPAVTKTPAAVQRFQREVEAAAKLRHPNVVATDDADEHKGTHFLVMEYIEGSDLSALVKKQGALSVERAVDYIIQAARGLQYAHEHGVIHRDIKPANLLVDKKGTVKILDMGLARIEGAEPGANAELTASGAVMGTVDYMAPEQALNTKTADARSDIYSLGISLWYVLTGKAAYDGDSMVAKLLAHQSAPIPSLTSFRPDVPATVDAVFQKMVAKKPDDRYPSMKDVIAALEKCQAGGLATSAGDSQTIVGGPSDNSLISGFLKGMADTAAGVSVMARKPATQPDAADLQTMMGQVSDAATHSQLRAGRPSRTAKTPWWRDRRAQIGGGALVGALLLWTILGSFTGQGRPKTNNSVSTPSTNPPASGAEDVSLPPRGNTPTTGWHGWPVDAPKPAIAPFDAVQAKQHQEEWAAYLKVPVEYTNSIGMKFRLIPPGEFTMGSTPEEIAAALKDVDPSDKHWQECIQSEAPQHKVILTQPVYLGVNEVTQAEYEKVMGVNPSHFAPMGIGKEAVATLKTAEHPVESANWFDAAEFCMKLSEQEKLVPFYARSGETIAPLDGTGYRLPSEAEWEIACRAGSTTKYWIGDKNEDLIQAGWFGGHSEGRTHAKGALKANPFGLSDIHGNVWEWVQDGWDASYYGQFSEKPAINPNSSLSSGSQRVVRGGNWRDGAPGCRSSNRFAVDPTHRSVLIGFRVSLPIEAVQQALQANQKPATTANTTWHGWPADAPKPALAPFDAAQAKQHQDEWAAYLKVPVEYTNSIGMMFRLIPPGEFTMGSTPEEIEAAIKDIDPNDKHWPKCIQSEAPQHKVILTQPIYLGVSEVTQAEYEQVMGLNPSHFAPMGMGKEAVAGLETANHPVETVSWNDAAEFCVKLSQQETLKPFYFRSQEPIIPLEGTGYRLPSEAEWEFACRAGTTTKFWIGDKDDELIKSGWIGRNSESHTHAAGKLTANPFGLSDIHGNVWEWVQDGWDATKYGLFREKPAINPNTPFSPGSLRVVRGGGWHGPASTCRSSARHAHDPPRRDTGIGFRVSLPIEAVQQALQSNQKPTTTAKPVWDGWPADAPKPALAPFDAVQAKQHQDEWAAYLKVPVEFTNTIGMKLRLIPPGEFTMGNTAGEEGRRDDETQVSVTLTRAFQMSRTEVTQGQWRAVMGTEPWKGHSDVPQGDDYPATYVSWEEAVSFCEKLSAKEEKRYRLPTEAEWEWACRAGSRTAYSFGGSEGDLGRYAWFNLNTRDIGEKYAHRVGQKLPNGFGLSDMHGNVWEWCGDWHDSKLVGGSNPVGASSGSGRVDRGGCWLSPAGRCRSASREWNVSSRRKDFLGFRLALSPSDAAKAASGEGIPPAKSSNTSKTAWHGWPADAPPPAIAPFSAAQAKKYQDDWAAYLKVPVEYSNSMGLKFRLIPPGEFTQGTSKPNADAIVQDLVNANTTTWAKHVADESPDHKVVLTTPFYLATTKVSRKTFKAFVAATKYVTDAERRGGANVHPDGFRPEHVWSNNKFYRDGIDSPVVLISSSDGHRLCAWLETAAGEAGYRLPLESEWEFACRAGDEGLAPSVPETPNPFGITGLLDWNVATPIGEWCRDLPRTYSTATEFDAQKSLAAPRGGAGKPGVMRGFPFLPGRPRFAERLITHSEESVQVGLRLVLPVDSVRKALAR